MTMKMINRTRRTSISGVTLISETAPPVFPPPIPIAISLINPAPATQQVWPLQRLTLLLRRRRRRAGIVRSLRKQAKLAHSGRADSIDRIHHLAVVRTLIGAHENLFA